MTAQQIKSEIITYLLRKGWRQIGADSYLNWRDPAEDAIKKYYCWHAAFVVEVSREIPQLVPRKQTLRKQNENDRR